jgi:uncharacterized protein (DUF111 family)
VLPPSVETKSEFVAEPSATAEEPEETARRVQRRVLERTGLRCAVGIGETKLQAKTATGFAKPGGIAATKAHVRVAESAVVRTAAHITGLVEEARLPDRVAQRALRTFRALAEVEGRLHRRPPEQVHFHEVGAVDAQDQVVAPARQHLLLQRREVALDLGLDWTPRST